jgi:hypothetical protein
VPWCRTREVWPYQLASLWHWTWGQPVPTLTRESFSSRGDVLDTTIAQRGRIGPRRHPAVIRAVRRQPDVEVTNHRPDATSETIPAEWHFAWALGGRAIQDVWTRWRVGSDPALLRRNHRCLALNLDRAAPPRRHAVPRTQRDGVQTRWIFSEIALDSVSRRAVDSDDDGVSWKLRHKMKARRLSS